MKHLATFKKFLLFCLTVSATTAVADGPKNIKEGAVSERDRNTRHISAEVKPRRLKSNVETTRLIRRALTRDDSLSIYATNIQIITKNGAVTLKGPVRSVDERIKVASIAQGVVGNKMALINHLEIKRR